MIVKGAGVIEGLGRARGILLDKTGTLTIGAPAVDRVVVLNGRGGGRSCASPRRWSRSPRTSWRRPS